MTRTIYLAHNFIARHLLSQTAVPWLERRGHEVTSRWIWDDTHTLESTSEKNAVMDLEDIDRASHFILFTEQYGPRQGRGKFFELGYAIKAGKVCILVGPKNGCVFYDLPVIRQADTLEDAMRFVE